MCMKCCNFPCKLSWVMCIYLNILIFFILRFYELTEIVSVEVFSHQYLPSKTLLTSFAALMLLFILVF